MVKYLKIMIDARFAKMEERGASAVEYGLLIAGIAALIVAVVFAFKDTIIGLFEDTCHSIENGGTAQGSGVAGDCS
jgi:pilus assembly protein Flp/PilA